MRMWSLQSNHDKEDMNTHRRKPVFAKAAILQLLSMTRSHESTTSKTHVAGNLFANVWTSLVKQIYPISKHIKTTSGNIILTESTTFVSCVEDSSDATTQS